MPVFYKTSVPEFKLLPSDLIQGQELRTFEYTQTGFFERICLLKKNENISLANCLCSLPKPGLKYTFQSLLA